MESVHSITQLELTLEAVGPEKGSFKAAWRLSVPPREVRFGGYIVNPIESGQCGTGVARMLQYGVREGREASEDVLCV